MRCVGCLLCIVLLSACAYRGDGQYQEHGLVLEWCHVSLPIETVESERFYVYSIAGMGCRLNYKDHVTLVLESDEPLTPENIDLGVAVKVIGNEGVYFYQAGYLNAYLDPAFSTQRMPQGNEWMRHKGPPGRSEPVYRLAYGSPVGGVPQCRGGQCRVVLYVFNVTPETEALRIHVEMSSSWK